MEENKTYVAGLYLRLSKDDDQVGESFSIGTQRGILTDFCTQHGYQIHDIYVDDGYSGLNFSRPDFQRLLKDVERGLINMVITKDLSRLGRDYIMTGYYSEIFFPNAGVRYIALADDFDSEKGGNEIAPFKNILNDMYARDISKKVKTAKHHRAKQGLFIGSQAPYGYLKSTDTKRHLIIDPEAAEVVRTIFSMAEQGMGNIAIAKELEKRKILTPSAYKHSQGDTRFARYAGSTPEDTYKWRHATINMILHNPVYIGQLTSLKTEVVNYKTKKHKQVPLEQQIITPNAHEAIIDEELFYSISKVRADHVCQAHSRRFNLFRGKLFCDCCGSPLSITKKTLIGGDEDLYFCMCHYRRPDKCPKTHRIYHNVLYPYVLHQIRAFAKSVKRRKANFAIVDYVDIETLTPEILDDVVERIEIGHVTSKSRPGNVIQIYWKFN